MSTSESGIILKSFLPYQPKLSVFTKTAGKKTVVLSSRASERIFSPGMIIQFQVVTRGGGRGNCSHIEIIDVLMRREPEHIYWVHHLFEICYYFAPLGAPSFELYECLWYCLMIEKQANIFGESFGTVKKICILKLLVVLGFYPEKDLVLLLGLFDYIVAVSTQTEHEQNASQLCVLMQKISRQMVDELDVWILQCIQQHPCAAMFKTVEFFDKV